MPIKSKRLRFLIIVFAIGLVLLLAACNAVPASKTANPNPVVSPTVTNPSSPTTSSTSASPPGSASTSSNLSSGSLQTTNSLASLTLNSPLEVYFLDVGQGDSELLRIGSTTMRIDAGTNASTTTLLNDIKQLGISRFDIVVGTHPHEDHIGGMDAVINDFDIGTIYMPKVSDNTQTFKDVLVAIQNKGLSVTTPIPGATFSLGQNVKCTILAPNSSTYSDLNSYSIVIKAVYGNTSFLFTGDAQSDSEAEMLSKGFDLKADVLKMGHHGSNTSTSSAFLSAVSPKFGLISVGKDNIYGLPTQSTLDKLTNANVKVYRTDLNGTIEFTSDGSHLNVIAGSPQAATNSPPAATAATTVAVSPSVTLVPISTPTLTPTATTNTEANLTLAIASITSPAKPGGKATLIAKTAPNAQCKITVYYKSGPSTASGLSPKQPMIMEMFPGPGQWVRELLPEHGA